MQRFNNCLLDCGLTDVGFKGPMFTWEWRGVKERLDMGVSNLAWRLAFPDASITHLAALKSDHKPLLLSLCTDQMVQTGNKPFRFMSAWLADPTFKPIVQQAWQGEEDWNHAVQKFQRGVKEWNVSCFGNIFHRKHRLMARMEGVNKRLAVRNDGYLLKLLQKLWGKYNSVLTHEELFWRQKSRCDWIKFWDGNTCFFHSTAVIHRKRNRIEALMNEKGDMVQDEK